MSSNADSLVRDFRCSRSFICSQNHAEPHACESWSYETDIGLKRFVERISLSIEKRVYLLEVYDDIQGHHNMCISVILWDANTIGMARWYISERSTETPRQVDLYHEILKPWKQRRRNFWKICFLLQDMDRWNLRFYWFGRFPRKDGEVCIRYRESHAKKPWRQKRSLSSLQVRFINDNELCYMPDDHWNSSNFALNMASLNKDSSQKDILDGKLTYLLWLWMWSQMKCVPICLS